MQTRKVSVTDTVWDKLDDLATYLVDGMKLSEDAAQRRIDRVAEFMAAFGNAADYPKCRFKRWRALDYRCAVFEKDWIFAYETFDEGVIVRDMSHAKLLKE